MAALMRQEDLARKARVHTGTIIRAEQGYQLLPLTQERIARALGMERSELFPESLEVSA